PGRDDRLDRRRRRLVAGLDRRREPGADVAAASAATEEVAAEVQRHPDEPRLPRLVGTRRRTLDRAHERLLHEVVGIGGRAGQAIAEPPEEAPVLAEDVG